MSSVLAVTRTSVIALALLATGCGELAGSRSPDAQNDRQQYGEWGVDLEARDSAVAPGEDFYRYVNGRWLKSARIPGDKAMISTYLDMADRAKSDVIDIINGANEQSSENEDLEKVGVLYRSFMDKDTINARGVVPVIAELEDIDTIETHKDVARLFARIDYPSFYYGYADIDQRQPDQYLMHIFQAGLTMPYKAYYIGDDPQIREIRSAFETYAHDLLELAGLENADDPAAAILALETRIAEAHWDAEDRRDRNAIYNKMTLAELEEYAPGYPWRVTLGELGVADEKHFIIAEKSAFPLLGEIFQSTPVETWKSYLRLRLLDEYAPYLTDEFEAAYFALYGTAMRGLRRMPQREYRGRQLVEEYLGEAVGKEYVRRHFSEETRQEAEKMVATIFIAFDERLAENEWRSAQTKAAAREKLSKMTYRVGFPESWVDYSSMQLAEGKLVENVRNARWHRWLDNKASLGQPIDKGRWYKTPQEVNAFYNHNLNTIGISAGMLQPPFFDADADPAVNYGAIGVIIAHEISHGFDDEGRKSDGDGVLRDWWLPEDELRFKALTESLGAQFAAYGEEAGFSFKPQLTMGENIADLGGVAVAYHAYASTYDESQTTSDGYSGAQKFFMSWAQACQGKYRKSEMRRRVTEDTHSLLKYRVLGPVSNNDAWYDAFDIQEDAEMYRSPETRVKIW